MSLFFIATKIALIFGSSSLLFSAVHSKKYLASSDGEITSPNNEFFKYFDTSNVVRDQLNDEIVYISGYLLALQDHPPASMHIKTDVKKGRVWSPLPVNLSYKTICEGFTKPDTYWYNVTKLMTNNGCPPKKGTKLELVSQNISMIIEFPPGTPEGLFRPTFTLKSLDKPVPKILYELSFEAVMTAY